MNKVVTVLGSVLAFGWSGLHVARLYLETHTHYTVQRWETQLLGLSVGAAAGLVVPVVLIKAFTSSRDPS